MSFVLFYSSIAAVWVTLFICIYFRHIGMNNIIIGITSTGYSLAYDIILGDQLGLYHYIDKNRSTLYMVLAGILLYPLLNIIYTLFMPERLMKVFIYTLIWIIGMLIFEYASIAAGTIVFTGWKPIPWSIVTYILTYTWIYLFYKHLKTFSAH